MPELPDVEVYKRFVDAHALHQKIIDVEVKNVTILKGVSAQRLLDILVGRQFTTTSRHGKHFFMALDQGPWLRFHFGMTGYFKYFEKLTEDPKHDRLRINFDNGFHLAFVNQRKFGAVGLVGDVEDYIKEKKLGPDALAIDWNGFQHIFSGKKGHIKSYLMNQKHLAGLGNVYSDEILFQSRLHPQNDLKKLDERTLRKLFEALHSVIKTAIAAEADPEKFPDTYLLRQRRRDGNCPRGHGKVKTLRMSGRTAYYCPVCQESEFT
jgi:formamidopyrimidine-DNA glycosylase